MREGQRRGRISAAEVETRLADAGRTLLALPWAGCFHAGFSGLWPGEGAPPSRSRVPTSAEIVAMDEAYRWTAFISDPEERRLVLMRSLVLPGISGGPPRHVWSWGRLRRATGLHPDTLAARWGRGIDRIVRELNRPDDSRSRSGRFEPAREAENPTVARLTHYVTGRSVIRPSVRTGKAV
jgi:hypothetical protein